MGPRQLFFPEVVGVRVDRVWREGTVLHIAATTTRRAARCPLCQRRSKRVHSHYQRTIADLPCGGERVLVHLQTRRFVCRVRWCRRRIFTERLPALVASAARCTMRLRAGLLRLGFALGGAPGARHATATGTPVSARTLLRLVRSAPTPEAGAVRVLGVDDWSQRRGRTYGTILVNLHTHRVIDLLPDRTAATLAAWLRHHPEVQVIARDRGGAYADGARQGAPQALQVADRFHLLKNVTDALERYLAHHHTALRQAAHALSGSHGLSAIETRTEEVVLVDESIPVRLSRHARLSHERRARRYGRYEEVIALHAQGHSLRAIARMVHLNKRTVQKFVRADGFPELHPRPPRRTLLTPFESYLQERWAAGCHNAKQLWIELCDRGFSGGHTIVAEHVKCWRTHAPTARPGGHTRRGCPTRAPVPCAPRPVCWLLLRPTAVLTEEEQAYITHLYHACPQIAVAEALVEEFATLLRERDVDGLYSWLHGVALSGIRELQAVAHGLWLDRSAVEAAVRTDWSSGQVEGQVNRLKVLKRVMFGRAKFDLLRQRVLHAAT
jgi:transposase